MIGVGEVLDRKWWHFNVLGFKIPCYNFEWRRRALVCHDLHHVVTGFPFTMRGECQVAAWEFSAGRYRNIFANLFCLPLVSLGMLLIPAQTFTAFLEGQKAATLFGKDLGADVGRWPLQRLNALAEASRPPPSYAIQILKFLAWVLASIAWTLGVPGLVGVALYRALP